MADKLMPSDPMYPEINRLQAMLVVLVNREIANRGGNADQQFVAGIMVGDIADAELQAIKTSVLAALGRKLEEVLDRFLETAWGEFINTLDFTKK